MKPTRRIATILLALVMTMCLLAACGGESGSNTGNPSNTNTPLAQDSTPESDDLAAIETAMAIEAEQTVDVPTINEGDLDLTKIDPCALLTMEEVETARGSVEVNPGRKATVAYYGGIGCIWADGKLNESISLKVLPKDATSAPALFYWDGAKSISGLGDEAYTDSDPQLGDGVWVVLKNRALIQLIVPLGQLEQARQLMPKVIERLNK